MDCQEAGIPVPNYFFEGSNFLVEFKKDILSEEYLSGLGLNERQVKAVLFTKEKGKISNSDYQQLNEIGKTTATEELAGLVNIGILKASTLKGRGSKYTIE
jgi:ATP-dependent DNA helicase RecG